MKYSSTRSEILACACAAFAFVSLLSTFLVGYLWARSPTVQTAFFPLTISLIFSVLSWWHSRLSRLKDEEIAEQEDEDSSRLFSDQDAGLRPAANALRLYDRYFSPAFTVFAGAVLVMLALNCRNAWYSAAPMAYDRDSLGIAGITLFLFLFCFLTGTYFNGTSREIGCRWLRPAAAWILFSSVGLLLSIVVMIAEYFDLGRWDVKAAGSILFLIIVFGIEMIINVIIEFYRPRAGVAVERPLYESRLLGMITEPGGLARNFAYTLDYQFGFRVSETWFYQFLERSFVPYLLLLVVLLYGLDSVVLIDTGEMGLKERFGNPVSRTPLGPGLYFKFPRPVENIRRYPVKKIQKISIGYHEHQDGDALQAGGQGGDYHSDRVILWNEKHYESEVKFLVASSQQEAENVSKYKKVDRDTGEKENIPVNILAATIPLYYKIDEEMLFQYAYNYNHETDVLEGIAYREIVNYLASVDFIEMIGKGRLEAKAELERRIRNSVVGHNPPIGVEILFVGLMGVHPSMEVAESFQNVVAADEQKRGRILEAKSAVSEQLNLSLGSRERLTYEAEAYRYRQTMISSGEAGRFLRQDAAYRLAPSLYKLRTFLDLLEAEVKDVQKYILACSSKEIFIVDLQQKLRPDLLEDLDITGEGN